MQQGTQLPEDKQCEHMRTSVCPYSARVTQSRHMNTQSRNPPVKVVVHIFEHFLLDFVTVVPAHLLEEGLELRHIDRASVVHIILVKLLLQHFDLQGCASPPIAEVA